MLGLMVRRLECYGQRLIILGLVVGDLDLTEET